MKSEGLYQKGEEKFGPIMSRLYSAFAPAFVGKLYKIILDEVNKAKPGSLLDVGCGPGIIATLLASEIKGLEVFCVDPSEYMVGIANRRILKHNLSGKVTAVAGSSRLIPFDRKFDMIITSLSFHHWKDKEGFFGLSANKACGQRRISNF